MARITDRDTTLYCHSPSLFEQALPRSMEKKSRAPFTTPSTLTLRCYLGTEPLSVPVSRAFPSASYIVKNTNGAFAAFESLLTTRLKALEA